MSEIAFLMNGYTACGKSTTARRILSHLEDAELPAVLLQTNRIRNAREDRTELFMSSNYFTEDSHRDIIYDIMFEKMKEAIRGGQIPILDATYNKRKWRTPIYEWSSPEGVELYVVKCICDDESEIMKRIALRIASGDDPHFLELQDPSSISKEKLEEFLIESFEIYKNIKNLSEDVDASEQEMYGLKLIVYDTLRNMALASFDENEPKSFDEIIKRVIRSF